MLQPIAGTVRRCNLLYPREWHMKKLLSSPLRAGLTVLCLAGMLSVPAMAGPPPANAPAAPAASAAQDVTKIRDERWRRPPHHGNRPSGNWNRPHRPGGSHWRPPQHGGNWHRPRPPRHHYYRPHYGGSGFYLGLGLGAPAYRYYTEPRRYYRPSGNAHVRWCYDRYRSYRASDNTFQPYNGPRRQCRSPYG
jgi:hypothetical protein